MDENTQSIPVRYAAPGTYISTVIATLYLSSRQLRLCVPNNSNNTEDTIFDVSFSAISKEAILRGSLTLWINGKRHVITPPGNSYKAQSLFNQLKASGVKAVNNTQRLLVFWAVCVIVVVIAIILSNLHH